MKLVWQRNSWPITITTETSTPVNKQVIRTGVYPHMPIVDRRSPQNTNSLQHWLSPTMRQPVSHTTHGPSLSIQVCCTELTTVERVIDFSIFVLGGLPLGQSSLKGRWLTIHLDLPSYKISAWSRKRSTTYALPNFFPFFGLGLTPWPKFTKRRDDLADC